MFRDREGGDWTDAVVLVVHAHPDDEVFATGAATIAAANAGATVHLRLFTGGEGRASELTTPALTAARLRKEESLAASTGLLGIHDWDYLAEPGRWHDTPQDAKRTIATASGEVLAGAVVEAIDALGPDVLLTVGPDGLTGHPDHVACHGAVRRALARSALPPRVALGAVLDRRAVERARHEAATTLGRTVGSGRAIGAALRPAVVTVTGPDGTAERRRKALDRYVPGLGTAAYADLTDERVGSGDSVLLRFVRDVSGWDRDHFVRLV
ncbi:MAG: PIG-L family deacetylase [Nocardioides sp.]|uniref:PIG-L deacetylase family protein n=1 Tax=Nocardioides sp. TaxID=35761 RepID=UPI0039E50570